MHNASSFMERAVCVCVCCAYCFKFFGQTHRAEYLKYAIEIFKRNHEDFEPIMPTKLTPELTCWRSASVPVNLETANLVNYLLNYLCDSDVRFFTFSDTGVCICNFN